MATRKSAWLPLLAIGSSLLLSSVASAQADWPTLKGSNGRLGYNINGDTGPGLANLRWWSPSSANNLFTGSFVVDNTDNNGIYGYGVNSAGNFTVAAGNPLTAINPPQVNSITGPWYVDPYAKGVSNIDSGNPWLEFDGNGNEKVPSYIYAQSIASDTSGDPTSAKLPSNLAVAHWNITPPINNPPTPNLYALYVWIPSGPQISLSPPAGVSSETFSQRYYVYQVTTVNQGQTKTFTDVVDTTISAGGWVRLGNGGAPTNMVFPYDGTDPFTITLFNTVPRDTTGALTDPVDASGARSNTYVVYADAAEAVPQNGYFDSSPVSATPLAGSGTRTVAALNQFSAGGLGNTFSTITTGSVTSYQFDTGIPAWTYSPVQAGSNPILSDVDPGNASPPTSWAINKNLQFAGKNYAETATIAGSQVANASMLYAPTLNSGTYQIYAYLPGPGTSGLTFGSAVEYDIYQGSPSTTTPTRVYINQNFAGGWVQLGSQRYTNTAAAPLTVYLTNGSNAASSADAGLLVYADALRFVGEQNQAISSTPVIATVNINTPGPGNTIVPVTTQVVIACDENGLIHCLDGIGNGDGTTKEYWTWPDASYTGIAPQGFHLSSAVITPVTVGGVTKYYLYIGDVSGHVFCIDMAGNADFTTTAPGTAKEVWTFPSTASSKLGAFIGSVTLGTFSGKSVVYAPAAQGRIYALDAVAGNSVWAYPNTTSAAIGPVATTPTFQIFNGIPYLYFGTQVNSADDSNGAFYCFNVNTSFTAQAPVWSYSGGTINNIITGVNGYVATSDFLSSPAVVPQNVVNATYPSTDGYVYAVNQNNYVYAFDATSGALIWASNELNVGALGATSFTQMTVYNSAQTLQQGMSIIMVPTLDGRFDGLFADPAVTNQYGTRRAYEFVTAAQEVASSLAMSNTWMYGTDESGFIYAFNNQSGYESQGNPPGGQTIVEDNPAGAVFRHASMLLVTQAGYNILRQPLGQNLDYYTATNPTNNPYTFTRTPLAFEWGESAYIMVYNFPYVVSNGTTAVAPPIINVTFSSNGKTVTRQAEARLFNSPPVAPDDPFDPMYPNGTYLDNGYAILQFPFGGGQLALPPGPGQISISLSTASLNSFGAQQTVALNPKTSNLPFYIANPLGLSMPAANGSAGYDPLSIGLSTSPSDIENLVNGSPLIPGDTDTANKRTNLLATSAGTGSHGSAITASMYVYDRSMMALGNANGTGLGLVRMDVKNLAWQGGGAAVWKPLNGTYYTNFEDSPNNFPNTSLDYPDIQASQIQVVSQPNGAAQNPQYGHGVNLLPPMVKDPNSGQIRAMQYGDQPSWRVFQPTPFNLTINVPRFQPPNSLQQSNWGGAAVLNSDPSINTPTLDQGYIGRVRVYVDSNTNGTLDINPAEAYRGFNLMTAVAVDEKLTVSTPTVNLGTMPQGTGYDPGRPGANYLSSSNATNGPNIFEPWSGNYAGLFQSFVVNNEGNVNMLDLRLAKYYQTPQGNPAFIPANPQPWYIPSSGNDLLGWLDGSTDSWSDIDQYFAPEGGPNREVALQKARVTDIAPTQLTANTVQRANVNLGTTGYFIPAGGTIPLPTVLNQTLDSTGLALKYPPVAPRVAVSVPLGMPVGQYSQVMRVIEKGSFFPTWTPTNNEVWQVFNNAPETYSDPTFTLNFGVKETQLTTSYSSIGAPMIDALTPPSAANPFGYSNTQPAMVRAPDGSLVVAWSSDRPSWNPAQPTSANQLGNYSIYMGAVGNSATFSSFGVSGSAPFDALSPLGDLDLFTPMTNTQWFKQSVSNYPPQAPDVLFNSLPGENVITGTVQYGNPSFPQSGLSNPFNLSQKFSTMYMVFTGSAQKQTPSGRIQNSDLFITLVQPSSGGNLGTPPQPVVNLNDPLVSKGKPSVLQTTVGADVFYPGTAGGLSNVYYTYFNGNTFGPSVALPFGSGFTSVTGVSAAGRIYAGVGSTSFNPSDNVLDLTFTGQLKGHSNPEVFLGQAKLDSASYAVVDDNGVAIDNPNTDGNVFRDLSQQSGEPLVLGSQPGLYRSLGVLWDPAATIQIVQNLNGVTTPLLVTGTGVLDRETGLIAYDSRLGGKVYIDTTLGTVRFATGAPTANAQILATYTPRFLRISIAGGAGYSKPTGMYDQREISNPQYWRTGAGLTVGAGADIPNDRFEFVYNRAAGGAALPARPYMTSLRFGIQLPFPVATDNNGNALAMQVMGTSRAVSSYQVDTANGRIYFTGSDEDNMVNVTYTAVTATGSTFVYSLPYQPTVTLIREAIEQPILIDTAVNESDVTAFLDPFSFVNAASRRPPMTWLFWSSTRNGIPDIYFETIAPQWSSLPINQ